MYFKLAVFRFYLFHYEIRLNITLKVYTIIIIFVEHIFNIFMYIL